MRRVKSICHNIEPMPDNNKKDVLLYGDSRFGGNKNKFILKVTINYLKNSERLPGCTFE